MAYNTRYRARQLKALAPGPGAFVPPELCDNILSYVVPLLYRTRYSEPLDNPLKKCSLVCRYWAQRCRRNLFVGLTIIISSVEDARAFRKVTLEGSRYLTPIHHLIKGITIQQTYDAPRSFCHLFQPLWTSLMSRGEVHHTSILELIGPIPTLFPNFFLDGPRWGFPLATGIPPSALQFSKITITNIHLPTFSHVIKFSTYLVHAMQISFAKVTWDNSEGSQGRLPRPPTKTATYRKKTEDASILVSGCTNNLRLCIWMSFSQLGFPLHALCDGARLWFLAFELSLMKSYSDDARISCTKCVVRNVANEAFNELPVSQICLAVALSQEVPTGIMTSLYPFYLTMDTPSRDDSTKTILAFQADPAAFWECSCIYLNILVANLGISPETPFMVFTFMTYRSLKLYIQPLHLGTLEPPANFGLKYVLACQRSPEHDFPEIPAVGPHDYIGINPITLEPTGQSWQDSDKIVPSLLKHYTRL